jgi:replicative DNA helicase
MPELKTMERVIIYNLLNNEKYSSFIYPFLESKYFEKYELKIIINKYKNYVKNYNITPSYHNMTHEIEKDKEINQETRFASLNILDEVQNTVFEYKSFDWLVDNTEEHLKKTSLIKAAYKIVDLVGNSQNDNLNVIQKMVTDALKISVRNTTGIRYGTDDSLESQYEYYHSPTKTYPFKDWTYFNKLLGGGCVKKRLHTILASTNVGKTLCMINMAQQYVKSGMNVLYISLEDDNNMVRERLDGCVLDINTNNLGSLPKTDYFKNISNFMKESNGELFVKYYPTASIDTSHISHLIDEIKLKHDIVLDAVFVDYIGCLKTLRYNDLGKTNTVGKVQAEELRGIAGEKDVVMWTAVQINREGTKTSDPDLTHIGDSWAIAQTADYAFIVSEDTENHGSQYICKQAKSRYKPIDGTSKMWAMQVNKYKQKLWEAVDPIAQFNDTTIPEEAKSYKNISKQLPNETNFKW